MAERTEDVHRPFLRGIGNEFLEAKPILECPRTRHFTLLIHREPYLKMPNENELLIIF